MIKYIYFVFCFIVFLRTIVQILKNTYYKINKYKTKLYIKKEYQINILNDLLKNKKNVEHEINIYKNKRIEHIKNNCQIIYCTTNDFTSCKVVLLAHRDPQDIIDPYVIYQAKHLKSLRKKVILCSASLLKNFSEEKNVFDAIVCRSCDGYSFTSWKACLELFPSLYKAEELTLCNDSVFGPFDSYKHIYDAMSNVKCDFWGITYSTEKIPHLESYHIVCLQNTLRNQAFKNFFDSVPLDGSRNSTIKLELLFSVWLELHGLKGACYRKFNSTLSPLLYPMLMLEHGVPVIKKELFKFSTWPHWQTELERFDYPLDLITNYFYRIGLDISTSLCPGLRSTTWPPSVFQGQESFSFPSITSYSHLKAAVILHCYYTETLKGIVHYLDILPNNFHLLISTDTEEKSHTINSIFSRLQLDNKIIRIVPNKGWDIGPFFNAFKDIIFDYDLICKLHAKTSTDLPEYKTQQWRDIIFNSLIGNKERVKDIVALFSTYNNLGMLIPPSPPFLTVKFGFNYKLCQKILNNIKINISSKESIDFPVGAMFWARPHALKPLFDLDLNFNKFDTTNSIYRDGTLAHALERCFLFSCCASGFKWCRISPIPYRSILANPHNLNRDRYLVHKFN